ncbi:tyrosine-protein phosphatase [Dyadobacter sp. CY351]|uniref:tyrosine-protein phosphatase n=1 Tax=Dyadobacter sp. CY351 TaxID=2909337 RepID=UPI001F3E46E9|nr:tyrosine-protein phosphatase [Dyadobacter sp. CY351]MCF2517503.1 tyrosine-protein phosphatase [Dyadobacter sp. CY351]
MAYEAGGKSGFIFPKLLFLSARGTLYIFLAGIALTACKVSVSENHDGKSAYRQVVHGEDSLLLAKRYIPFGNTLNFRDIGGLKTKDGRIVRLGKIYRSGNLASLDEGEFDKLNSLHIASVYDLRTDHEIKGKEDRLPPNVKYFHTPTVEDKEGEIAQLKTKVINGQISEQQAFDKTIQFYEDAVSLNVNALREIMQDILDSDAPVVYHCSAGKDRTGIISALILSILKVDRETIVNEYLLSNYYRQEHTESTLRKAKLGKIIKRKMDLKAVEVFITVDERFINATFETIDKKYGGIEQFIKNQLGIDQKRRELLIERLTYQEKM